jgi:hypothetical protein
MSPSQEKHAMDRDTVAAASPVFADGTLRAVGSRLAFP